MGAEKDGNKGPMPQFEAIPDPASHFADRPVAELIDYLLQYHHAFVQQELPTLLLLLDRCVEGKEPGSDAASTVRALLENAKNDAVGHMEREEHKLFPWLCAMENGEDAGDKQILFDELKDEHDHGGEGLVQMELAASAAILPGGNSEELRQIHERLKAVYDSLRTHIDLERKVLQPKALALIKRLR